MGLDQQIEHVARAFFGVENDEQTWNRAPENVKDKFRSLATDAIVMVSSSRESSIRPLSTEGPGAGEMVSA